MQYTIRNIPPSIDQELREQARRKGKSLNQTVMEVLRSGLGIADDETSFTGMDDLIGTWQADEAFDRAIAEQDTVDEKVWQ